MAQNRPEIVDNGTVLIRFFSHPIVGMVGWAATVLSLVLGIFFYIQSTKNRDVVCFVNPVQTVVVKSGGASNLHVFYGDRELKSDVTAAQIAVWNSGNESVRPENILEPVTIHTSPSVQILEASIRKKSRGVVDVSLDQSRLNEGVVGVKWNIFEQGDGAVIQLVYAGPPSTLIEASGVIEGQDKIRQLKGRGDTVRASEGKESSGGPHNRIGWFLIALGIIMALAGSLLYWLNRWRPIRSPSRSIFIGGIILSLFYIAFGLYSLLFLSTPNPPFGF
jgi:hypothetical protein